MPDILSPAPLTASQRLAQQIIGLQTRIDALERTMPRNSFGAGPPVATNGIPGSIYVDQTNTRVYFLGPGPSWVSADLTRGYVFAPGSVSTANTTVTDLGGPSLSITVPTNGFVMAYIQADIASGTSTGGFTTGAVWLYEPTDIPNPGPSSLPPLTSDAVHGTAWQSMATAPNTAVGYVTQPSGAAVPYGDFLVFRATPGLRTYSLRYSTWASVGPGGGTASFQNRRLVLVTI